jgi:hypothetical protein
MQISLAKVAWGLYWQILCPIWSISFHQLKFLKTLKLVRSYIQNLRVQKVCEGDVKDEKNDNKAIDQS